jgi:AraC-like DNA-binding protein
MMDSAMHTTSFNDPQALPRQLYLPPAGRPRWVCPESMPLDLRYLSWGKRQFGRNPIPVSLHHGWVYFLVGQGNPALQMLSGTFRAQPRQGLLVGPDCASGWTDDDVDGVAEVLSWVWRSPPRCNGLAPAGDGFSAFNADRALVHTLRQIHASCRREVEQPDALTAVALEELRLRLDVALARSLKPRPIAPEPALRLEFALRWLSGHLVERNPVTALSEYLQVSPVTANRLFQTHLHESVGAYHARLRMVWARHLLETERVAVKEVAYTLGYRHSNDFSRAFKKFTGRNPSGVGAGGRHFTGRTHQILPRLRQQ